MVSSDKCDVGKNGYKFFRHNKLFTTTIALGHKIAPRLYGNHVIFINDHVITDYVIVNQRLAESI